MIYYNIIVSRNQIIKNKTIKNQISSEFGKILYFEMETAGLINNFLYLMIRRICDYTDLYKNKKWQLYAAGAAAVYTKKLLLIIPAVDIVMI